MQPRDGQVARPSSFLEAERPRGEEARRLPGQRLLPDLSDSPAECCHLSEKPAVGTAQPVGTAAVSRDRVWLVATQEQVSEAVTPQLFPGPCGMRTALHQPASTHYEEHPVNFFLRGSLYFRAASRASDTVFLTVST